MQNIKNRVAFMLFGIIIFISILSVCETVGISKSKALEIINEVEENLEIKKQQDQLKPDFIMRASAYDLSVESCGKPRNHKLYGITRSGVYATKGRTVAVDPKVIPLGTKLKIEFDEPYTYLNGEYIAEDTGGAIKGNWIDIFFGEDKQGERKVYNECIQFGMRSVKVYLIKNKESEVDR